MKAAAHVLGLSPGTARVIGRRDAPPLVRDRARLTGMVMRLRSAQWTRAQIVEYLQIPRSLVDRTIDGTPEKLVLHPYHRKPKNPAAPAAPPEATSPSIEGPEVSTEPAAGVEVLPLTDRGPAMQVVDSLMDLVGRTPMVRLDRVGRAVPRDRRDARGISRHHAGA